MDENESKPVQPGRKYDESERVGEQVALLLGMLASNYSEAKTSAIVQLSRIGEPAVPHLLQALRDARRREGDREASRDGPGVGDIAHSLGMIGSPSAVGVLSEMLDDRGDSFFSLGGTRSENPVAEALGKIGTKEALDALARNLHKGGASAALGRFGDDRVGALLKVLESSDATRQATAAQQLGTLGASAAVPKLLTLLGAPENSVKAAAIDALSEIGDHAAIPHLRALLKTAPPEQTGNLYWRQDDEVRSRAVNALAKLGGVSVIPDLWRETLAGDRDAKSALIQMGDTAIPSLVDVLVKGDAGAQKVAAELISEIKAGGKRA